MTTWLFYLNSWLYEVIWPPIVQQLPDPPLYRAGCGHDFGSTDTGGPDNDWKEKMKEYTQADWDEYAEWSAEAAKAPYEERV